MGRKTRAPWHLFTRTVDGTERYYVGFRHAGRRYKLSTGRRDLASAQSEAARIYAETISGRRAQPQKSKVGGRSSALDVLFAEWLASLESTHDKTTVANYEMYVLSHFLPYFGALSGLTTASCSDYSRMRLRHVQATTVRKEHSALRGFISWCVEAGHLHEDDAPIVRPLPKRATGTPDDVRRKVGGWVDLTAAEASAILGHLATTSRKGFPTVAYCTALWETMLRPETLCSLRAPHDYRRGVSTHLTIRDEADKARFGRELPLTLAARAALDSVCPDAGYLFPRRKSGKPPDYRISIRAAARLAGLDEERASRISAYDFRHGRTTHLVEVTNDLLGVAYLAGHSNITTTNRYLHPRLAHGERALGALGLVPVSVPVAGTKKKRSQRKVAK